MRTPWNKPNKMNKAMRAIITTLVLAIVCSAGCVVAEKNAGGANEVRVQITGTVTGPEGKPVMDAIVMVYEKPRLCTITGADGSFSITGTVSAVPITLWSSWTATKTKEVP